LFHKDSLKATVRSTDRSNQ